MSVLWILIAKHLFWLIWLKLFGTVVHVNNKQLNSFDLIVI